MGLGGGVSNRGHGRGSLRQSRSLRRSLGVGLGGGSPIGATAGDHCARAGACAGAWGSTPWLWASAAAAPGGGGSAGGGRPVGLLKTFILVFKLRNLLLQGVDDRSVGGAVSDDAVAVHRGWETGVSPFERPSELSQLSVSPSVVLV